VKLDASYLGTRKELTHVNVVDGVAGDDAEHWSQTADDAGLLAMRNRVVSNDMVADRFFGPPC